MAGQLEVRMACDFLPALLSHCCSRGYVFTTRLWGGVSLSGGKITINWSFGFKCVRGRMNGMMEFDQLGFVLDGADGACFSNAILVFAPLFVINPLSGKAKTVAVAVITR